jgi:uncharacterized protein YqgC (DUF456 family)
MKYYIIALFLAIVFSADALFSTSQVQKVGAGALAGVFGIIGFALLLYNYFRPKKK